MERLERERDEAREKWAKSEEEYCKLYDKCHELKALCRDGKEALAWALDLLDMYDGKLIDLGESPHDVYSQAHLAGKVKARDVEKRLREAGGDDGTGEVRDESRD
jgi:hypothetical protein